MATSLFGVGDVLNASSSGTIVPQSFIGTDGQTVFNLTNFTYTPNTASLDVYVNGNLQISGRDYTEASSSSFILLQGVVAGDFVDAFGVVAFTPQTVSLTSILVGGTYTLAQLIAATCGIHVQAYPYLADPTGTLSAVSAITNALAFAAANQIGEVYFDNGIFLIDSAFPSQPGVRLIGTMRGPYFADSHGAGANQIGTTLLMRANIGNAAAQPTITFPYNSGIENVGCYWPDQVNNVTGNVAGVVPMPYAFQVGQNGIVSAGNSDSVSIRNVTLLNPYNGIKQGDGINFAGQTILQNVNIFPLMTGLALSKTLNSSSFNINITPTWWQQNATILAWLLVNGSIGLSTNVKDYAPFSQVYINLLNFGWVDTSTGNGWVEASECVIDECSVPLTLNGSTRFTYTGGTISRGAADSPLVRITGAVDNIKLTGVQFVGAVAAHSCAIFADHTSGTVTITGGTAENCNKPFVISTGTGAAVVAGCANASSQSGTITWADCAIFNGSVNGVENLVKGADVTAEFTNMDFSGFTAGLPNGWSGIPNNTYCTQVAGGIKIGGGTGTFQMAQAVSTLWQKYGDFILEFNLRLDVADASSYFYAGYGYNSGSGSTPYRSNLGGDAGFACSLPQGQTFVVRVPVIGGRTSDMLRFFFSSGNAANFFTFTNMKMYAAVPPNGQTGCEYGLGIGNDTPILQYSGGLKTMYVPSIPTAGTWGIGDRAVRYPPAVGQPKAWVFLTANTFPPTSEGNL